jgi:hypothetical protein
MTTGHRAATEQQHREHPGARRAPRWASFVLLAIFLVGHLVMGLTRDWLASAPFHDHLYLHEGHNHGHGHGLDAGRHHHPGDALDRAGAALIWVKSGALDLPAKAGGFREVENTAPTISLRSDDAVSLGLSLLSLVATIAALLGLAPRSPAGRVHAGNSLAVAGVPHAPLSPPPRAA